MYVAYLCANKLKHISKDVTNDTNRDVFTGAWLNWTMRKHQVCNAAYNFLIMDSKHDSAKKEDYEEGYLSSMRKLAKVYLITNHLK